MYIVSQRPLAERQANSVVSPSQSQVAQGIREATLATTKDTSSTPQASTQPVPSLQEQVKNVRIAMIHKFRGTTSSQAIYEPSRLETF